MDARNRTAPVVSLPSSLLQFGISDDVYQADRGALVALLLLLFVRSTLDHQILIPFFLIDPLFERVLLD